MGDFAKGSNFVKERTGSATMINLGDSRENDFAGESVEDVKRIELKPKKRTQHHGCPPPNH